MSGAACREIRKNTSHKRGIVWSFSFRYNVLCRQQSMRLMKTLYDLLGIDSKATQAQIEQGYKKRLDHYLNRQGVGKPDEETRRMQMVREAYLLLCSPQRRQTYDQQLRIYEKAREHFFNRANRKFAALVMVVVLAVVAGMYMHKMSKVGWNRGAQEMADQSMANSSAGSMSDALQRGKQAESGTQQVARSN